MKKEVNHCKEMIFKLASKNIYINNFCHEFREKFSGVDKIENIVMQMSNMDFFNNISELKMLRELIEKDKHLYSLVHVLINKKIYGIWPNLFGKCNIQQIYETPSIEHGLILYEQIFSDITHNSRASCATFGPFRKKIIQSKFKIPVFCVGPYIHYAEFFYSNDELVKMKKKLGKTLLVFPTHSTFASDLTVQQQDFVNMVNREAANFNSVLINSFWWNVNDPLIQKLENEGYKIISCGHKDDVNFLSRLKSYLYLADYAIGDSVGTHIGYCVDCNVPFGYREINTINLSTVPVEAVEHESSKKNIKIIKKVFHNSHMIEKEEKKITEIYWGTGCIKTEDELQKICDITRDLTRLTNGFRSNLYKKSIELLENYQKDDIIKFKLLLEALPENYIKEILDVNKL